jgi:hypothetical protein
MCLLAYAEFLTGKKEKKLIEKFSWKERSKKRLIEKSFIFITNKVTIIV